MEKSIAQSQRETTVNPNLSRRRFLGGTAAAGATAAAGVVTGAQQAQAADVEHAAGKGTGVDEDHSVPSPLEVQLATIDPESTFFATVFIEHAGTVAAEGSDGDLWPTCWADDGNVYTSNGDGRGFSEEQFRDVVFNRIDGAPEDGLTGEKLSEAEEIGPIWGDPEQYNRKPTGLVCAEGVLYLAMQDLKKEENPFDEAPTASISRSEDYGRTWSATDEPMFPDHRFTTIFFLDFGKNNENATVALGEEDGAYVYAYGLDWNWRPSVTGLVPDPVSVYLARVPTDAVQDRSKWVFFTGTDGDGSPRWSEQIEDKAPVLTDMLRRYVDLHPDKNGGLPVIGQGGVLYNPALERYIFTSCTNPSFEFYESPTPWGPWKRFLYHNTGLVEWYPMNSTEHPPKNGGYGTTIPAKYVSDDGQDMWVQSNWWEGETPEPHQNYNFNLRRLRVTPFQSGQRARNRSDGSQNLARTGADVTPIQVCAHNANIDYLNDDDRSRSEHSLDGTYKRVDFWGYTFSEPYRMNRVEYTTGTMDDDGGWFTPHDGGLRVQVRQEHEWVDGVRIIGAPGGRRAYTSIAELEVYFGG